MIRPAAATALVAGAGLVWAPSPAAAAACSDDSGVTVVVDFHELGGGIDQDCVADQGQSDDLFVAAGHTLENVQGQAFVCRVDGLPSAEDEACVRTPPADAYWSLWWSDGTDGTWTYSSQGAYALDVPDGGAVAFSWTGSSSTSKPGVAPPKHEQEASPEPTEPPSGGGGGAGAGGGTTPGGATSTPAAPTADPEGSPAADGDVRERRRDRDDAADSDRGKKQGDTPKGKGEKEDEPSGATTADEAPDEAPAAAEPPAAAGGDGLPVWVGPAAAGGALAIAGLAAYLRRRAA